VGRTINLSPENLLPRKKQKRGPNPANEVTTGFGVELEAENPKRSIPLDHS
jgi:hypothetical protein